jgi:deoxyribodipyrimidine photo-lyase
MKYTLFIFRRDLRIVDNKTLNFAMRNYENIIPIFIFTPEQVTNKNKFKSNNAIQFMIESLKFLKDDLQNNNSDLHLFYGDNIKVLDTLTKYINIDRVMFNMDYTPYARNRDAKIVKWCSKKGIDCIMKEDYLINSIGSIVKDDGSTYTVFTPFKNRGLKCVVDKPKAAIFKNLTTNNDLPTTDFIEYQENENIMIHGGRKNGIRVLKNIKNHMKYDDTRNIMNIETTHLSAYIKFGCVSIREVYWMVLKKLGLKSGLMAQLFWREFYYYIAYYFPDVLKGKNYNKKYNGINWNIDNDFFKKWCAGETGYPIVDAAMKQLNTTGYMHNRGRLITSNFLNRLLGYHWSVGEKYFARMLTDYDPAVNNGNWQWIASTGVDPKPYFQRLFSPILQSKNFDPDALYIKKWLPNLKNIPARDLHNWEKTYKKYDLKKIAYVKPIVEYKQARENSVKMYREVL